MTDHEQRLQDLGLSDWPHTVRKVCANQEFFSEADRERLAKRLQAYARRHHRNLIYADEDATLSDICVNLVQHVSSFTPEPLSPTDQLWFLNNVADKLKLNEKTQETVRREVEKHVVKDGWSWKKALVVALASLAVTNGIASLKDSVPVCNAMTCAGQPVDSVVAQLETGEIIPQQLAWSLNANLRDYMDLHTSLSGPATISETWVQDLGKSMDVYYEVVRDHDAKRLVEPQHTALQKMLTDLEFQNNNEETPIGTAPLLRDVREIIESDTVDNKQLVHVFGEYAAWVNNNRESSTKHINLGNKQYTVEDIKQNVPDDVIILPSFAPVTISELNRMAGLRTFLFGVNPLVFALHDLNHMQEIYINLATAKPDVDFVEHVKNPIVKKDLDKYRSEYQKGNLEKIPTPDWDELEAEQMRYRELIKELKETELPNIVEEVENVFFYLWHEQGIPITTLARMTTDQKHKFESFIITAMTKKEPESFFRVANGSRAAAKLLFNHFRASPLAPMNNMDEE